MRVLAPGERLQGKELGGLQPMPEFWSPGGSRSLVSTPTIDFLQASPDPADLTEYTFTDQSLGAAAQDRAILVGVIGRAQTENALTLDAATIGGVTATIIDQVDSPDGLDINMVAIIGAIVPAGTTGDIDLTFNRQCIRAGIASYRATGISLTPAELLTSTAADPSVALDVPAGGFAIGTAIGTGATPDNAVWTGLTEDWDVHVENFAVMTAAHDLFATAQTDLTITADFDSSAGSVGIFASFGAG